MRGSHRISASCFRKLCRHSSHQLPGRCFPDASQAQLSPIFWQLFSGQVNNVKERYELQKRIESLEKVTLGKMPEESYEAEAEKERMGGGLQKRVQALEAKLG